MYLQFITLGLTLLQQFLTGLKTQAPAQVVAAVEAAVAAVSAHKDDIVNKQNLEANRG